MNTEKLSDLLGEMEVSEVDLLWQIFKQTGISKEENVEVYTLNAIPVEVPQKDQPGWQVCLDDDDLTLVLLKDAKPLASIYFTFRGVYQGGAYLKETNKFYYSNNFREETAKDTWREVDDSWITPGVAKDALDGVESLIEHPDA